jgi:hypothetical protein
VIPPVFFFDGKINRFIHTIITASRPAGANILWIYKGDSSWITADGMRRISDCKFSSAKIFH